MLYIASLLLFLFLLRRSLTVTTVYGRSMEPTLFPGDRVILPAHDVPAHHERQAGALPEQNGQNLAQSEHLTQSP